MWLARALAYASRSMSQINQQPRFAKRGCFGLKGFQIYSGQIFSGRFLLLDPKPSAFCGCLLQVRRQERVRSRPCKRGIILVIAAASRIGKGMTCSIPMRCHQIAFASLGKVFLKSANHLWIDGFIQSAKMTKKRRIQFLQTVSIGGNAPIIDHRGIKLGI